MSPTSKSSSTKTKTTTKSSSRKTKNRDIIRQNKASSVIDGKIYSNITNDCILSIEHLSEQILSIDDDTLSKKVKIY